MKLDVVRFQFGNDCTIGQLMVNGEYECWTLEDVVRPAGAPKVYGKTAIPYGTYDLVITFSNRFQRDLPLVRNVPGFEGIRIHPGNTADNTEGCLLVGTGRTSTSVTNSRVAFNALFVKIRDALRRGEKVSITYKAGEAP